MWGRGWTEATRKGGSEGEEKRALRSVAGGPAVASESEAGQPAALRPVGLYGNPCLTAGRLARA